MTKCRAIQNSIEARTGVLWGAYRLSETLMADGKTPQARAYFMFHPKDSSLVRVEFGLGRRGYYLSWDEIPKIQRTRRLGLRKAWHASR